MAKTKKRPVLEHRIPEHGEKLKDLWFHSRYAMSTHASLAVELFKAEMLVEEPSRATVDLTYQPAYRNSVEVCVARACDGVSKLFAEMMKRGWIIEVPPLVDCIDSGVNFGMTGGHRGKDQAG
jgi:hypothetical protein